MFCSLFLSLTLSQAKLLLEGGGALYSLEPVAGGGWESGERSRVSEMKREKKTAGQQESQGRSERSSFRGQKTARLAILLTHNMQHRNIHIFARVFK